MSAGDAGFDRLAARLLARVRALAAARRPARLAETRRAETRRWRDARLLWPLLGKD
ncbi:MAG: hypothetical protein WCY29_14305 [Novosphingobium sp.]